MGRCLLLILAAVAGAFTVKPFPALSARPVRSVNVVSMRLGGWGSLGKFLRPSGSSPKKPGRFTGSGGLFFKPPGSGGGPKGPVGPTSRFSEADDSSDDKKEEPTGPWAAYEKALDANPLLIKGLTSFVGFTIGDLLAQFFIEKKGPYDPYRTFRLASFGFLIHGTTSHWFYGKLDGAIPGKGAGAVASKVFIDQVLWNPCFGVLFFTYMGLLEGSGINGTILKVKRDLITQVTGSWTVWPLAHAINFKFVPTEQRVLYINTIQIFYNCFLSIIGSKKVETA